MIGQNTFTGCEKEFRHIHFTLNGSLIDRFSILVFEMKWSYITQHRKFHFSISWYHPGEPIIETNSEQHKKAQVKKQFLLLHFYNRLAVILTACKFTPGYTHNHHFSSFDKLFATKLQNVLVLPYLCIMNRINWDAWGVATSLACAIHCAVLPLLLSSLPVFGINIIENEPF